MSKYKKRGVILMNLGSPDSTSVSDVRKYLVEFLMDERVIDQPYFWRSLLVKGIISPFRAPKSAEAYHSIWTKDGSPLVAITRQLQEALSAKIEEPVQVSMRYGNPSMTAAYDTLQMRQPDLGEVILVPLYPQYAMSSYETAVEHAKAVHQEGKYPFEIKFVPPFYNDPLYIAALADSIKPYLKDDSFLLFSYHSIPERHIHKSDVTGSHCLMSADCCQTASPAHAHCYRHQCYETTRLLTTALGIPAERHTVSFQSKLGRAEWLKPATTRRLQELPAEGKKDILVVSPAFVSDCLETLEEVAIREKENFLNSGGTCYTFIPCLNTHPMWVDALATWINKI